MADNFFLKMPDFHVTFRDLLHAVNLRHWTDGFTSPPKEGLLRIFFALKNPTVSAGFEPANLGTKGQQATSRPPKPQFVSLPLTSSSTLTMQTLALTINYLVRRLWTREVPVDLWSAWTLGVSVVFWTDLPVSFSGICYCRVINVYNRSCFCLQVANYTMF